MAYYNYKYRIEIKTFERLNDSNVVGNQIGETIVIEDPITIDLNVTRSPYTGNNQGTFDIYNLAPEKRKKIFYDYYYQLQVKVIEVWGGYENGPFTRIYWGHIKTATSKRVGVDVVTHIESIVGLLCVDTTVSETLKAGTSDKEVMNNLMSFIPVNSGTQTFKEYNFIRPPALYGNTLRLMKSYTNGRVFQDLDEVYVLDDREIAGGDVLLITDDSGLLGTPERQSSTVTINMMFEPRLQIGHGVEVRSSIEPAFDGQYKVFSIKHSGKFGYGTSGNVKTTIELWCGAQYFKGFTYVK